MQFESFQREEPKINMSALIDVVFILLIFVVLAANFDRIGEMNVVLPSSAQAAELRADPLVLEVPLEGPMLLGDRPIEREALFEELLAMSEEFDVLVLMGDGRIDLEATVEIFEKASAAGFESVSVATQRTMP